MKPKGRRLAAVGEAAGISGNLPALSSGLIPRPGGAAPGRGRPGRAPRTQTGRFAAKGRHAAAPRRARPPKAPGSMHAQPIFMRFRPALPPLGAGHPSAARVPSLGTAGAARAAQPAWIAPRAQAGWKAPPLLWATGPFALRAPSLPSRKTPRIDLFAALFIQWEQKQPRENLFVAVSAAAPVAAQPPAPAPAAAAPDIAAACSGPLGPTPPAGCPGPTGSRRRAACGSRAPAA